MLTTSKIFFLLLTSCGLCVSLAQQADPELLILEQRAKDSLFYGATNTSLRYYQTILKSNAATPADQLKACIGLASTFLKMEQLDSAMVYNSRANKLFNDIKSADVFYEARILDNYGWFTFRSLGKNSQYNKASEYFNKALDLKKKSKLTTDVDLARSYLNLSIIQTDINEFESSRLFLKQAEDLLNCQDPRCKILNASIHREYGTLLWLEGQPDAALIEFNESLLLALEVFDQENTYFATLYNLMSLLYMEQQRIYQAIDYLNKGLAVNIAEYGLDQHFMQIVIHNNLGEAYYLVGDEEKALFHTNKTLKMGLQAFGPGFSELFYPYSQLGQIYGDARGLPFLTKALQLAKTAGDKTRLSTINGYLAMVYFRLENYDKALSFAQESLRYREAIVKTNSIKLINDHELIAKIYLELGDLDKSLYHNSLSLAMNAAGNQELEYTELSSISMEDCLDQETLILAFNQRSNILYELYKNSGLE